MTVHAAAQRNKAYWEKVNFLKAEIKHFKREKNIYFFYNSPNFQSYFFFYSTASGSSLLQYNHSRTRTRTRTRTWIPSSNPSWLTGTHAITSRNELNKFCSESHIASGPDRVDSFVSDGNSGFRRLRVHWFVAPQRHFQHHLALEQCTRPLVLHFDEEVTSATGGRFPFPMLAFAHQRCNHT